MVGSHRQAGSLGYMTMPITKSLSHSCATRPPMLRDRANCPVARGLARTADAVRHYREALGLWPESVEALNNLARILAAHPQVRPARLADLLFRGHPALTDRPA